MSARDTWFEGSRHYLEEVVCDGYFRKLHEDWARERASPEFQAEVQAKLDEWRRARADAAARVQP